MKSNETFFISTAIPYVNSVPHAGHALEFVQADVIARYQRLRGRDVYFLSGTDDNALKNVLKAEDAGEDVRSYIARHTELFKKLLSDLNISNDDFIRTSVDERHLRGAQKLWQSFDSKDIFKKKYRGQYCVGCEEFKTEKELENGHCPEHPNMLLQEVEEENYFFRLGNYSNQLEQLIASDTIRITPRTRKNEVLAFIREGLEDLSISRSIKRARGWGVPVPGDPGQVQYVWVDALSNYINALGYADNSEMFQKYWGEHSVRMHVIGKGITRFHAIYWPAFLLSAGVPLPTDLVVHGYITSGGQKMSKSLGNVINPFAVLKEYGADALRYFLLRHIHSFEDSDFTMEGFKELYNANLANGLGNLAARIMKLAETHLDSGLSEGDISKSDREKIIPQHYEETIADFDFQETMKNIWLGIKKLDEFMTDTEPYKQVKTDKESARANIRFLREGLFGVAYRLRPMMPETSSRILEAIKANKKPENLFPRKE